MNNKLEIPIMFCFDNNYVIPAGVAFYSLLENANKNYYYKFYVLHSDISLENQKKLIETVEQFKSIVDITFINMEHKFQDLWNTFKITGHFSKEVMYKVLVASIFPQYDKIITSDVDVVFLSDISDSYISFNTDKDIYIAGTKMIGKMNWYMSSYEANFTKEEIEKLSSFCGGYLVFNLKKIRQDDMESKFIECFKINGNRINQMEQDVLNLCCYPKIQQLPLKYVACSYLWDLFKKEEDLLSDENYTKEEIIDAMENTVQLHFATSTKPWNTLDCTKAEEWFKYLVKTPFAKEFLSNIQNKIDNYENLMQYNKQLNKQNTAYKIIRHMLHNLKAQIKNKFLLDINPTLLIIDDIFPSKISAFRYEEFMSYLNYFPNVFVASSGNNVQYFNQDRTFSEVITDFKSEYPEHANKIIIYDNNSIDTVLDNFAKNCDRKIAVFTFINNVCMDNYRVLKFLEDNSIPFIFTLYPGGGFSLHNNECDEKLKRVFSSKCFKKVIVTQKIVYDYLINNKFCTDKQIKFIYGVVTPSKNLKNGHIKKILNDKINICFVAYKYSKDGKDKGFDLFIDAAQRLIKTNDNYVFHVIGNFYKEDIAGFEENDKICFHGVKTEEELSLLLKQMHIIVSPNRKNILVKGSFDGFPTGSCTEAMANRSGSIMY